MNRIASFLMSCILSLTGIAQETVGLKLDDLRSPVIGTSNQVKFSILAPQADNVELEADFLPPITIHTPLGPVTTKGRAKLKKDTNGVWTYVSAPLNPELHTYCFHVDGIRMTDPNNVYILRDIATYTNYFLIDGELSANYFIREVPHGTISKVWYPSRHLGLPQRRMTVYTPAGYADHPEQKYPVLYLLHGAGGDENSWSELGRACQILDNLISQKKAQPMIVVMPNGNGAQEAAPGEYPDSMYRPSFRNQKTTDGSIEEAFTDIITYVDSHYRTYSDKAHRAIAGLSMGGFHSLYISANNPSLFSYVGLFFAAININDRNRYQTSIYTGLDEKLTELFHQGIKDYFIAIGKGDFLYRDNTAFREKLDRAGYTYTYIETDGGHEWKNWRKYLNWFVPRLFQEPKQECNQPSPL